jgi:hypothetical protein
MTWLVVNEFQFSSPWLLCISLVARQFWKVNNARLWLQQPTFMLKFALFRWSESMYYYCFVTLYAFLFVVAVHNLDQWIYFYCFLSFIL